MCLLSTCRLSQQFSLIWRAFCKDSWKGFHWKKGGKAMWTNCHKRVTDCSPITSISSLTTSSRKVLRIRMQLPMVYKVTNCSCRIWISPFLANKNTNSINYTFSTPLTLLIINHLTLLVLHNLNLLVLHNLTLLILNNLNLLVLHNKKLLTHLIL